ASPRTLASGKTETGSFYAVSNTPSASGNIAAAISFPFPLPAAPTTHYVASGGPAPSACPGTASHPRATPGSLCAYETLNTTGNPAQFNGDVLASKFGAAILAVQSSGTRGSDTIAGTWAAT